jgi:hypothetical protein
MVMVGRGLETGCDIRADKRNPNQLENQRRHHLYSDWFRRLAVALTPSGKASNRNFSDSIVYLFTEAIRIG